MDDDTALEGYVSVALSVLFFGSFGLPLRIKAVKDLNVHAIVFQSYFSFAVFVTSWVALAISAFQFTIWGMIGAAMWVPINLLAIVAINELGLAIPIAYWAGITILVSFFWGAVAFQESISNIPLAMVALLMLVIGIVGLCACNATITIQLPSSLEFLYATPFFARPIDYSDLPAIATEEPIKPQEIPSTHSFDYSESSSLLQPETPAAADSAEFTRRNWIVGMTCASLVGVLNGSMMVPLKFKPDSVSDIHYYLSFAIGVAATTIVIAVGYVLLCVALRWPIPQLHLKIGGSAGMVSGTVWNVGFFFSIFATKYLGFTVGFPLTQCSLLVSGIWGLLLFREITNPARIVFFFASAGVLLGGAAMLSAFG